MFVLLFHIVSELLAAYVYMCMVKIRTRKEKRELIKMPLNLENFCRQDENNCRVLSIVACITDNTVISVFVCTLESVAPFNVGAQVLPDECQN